MWVRYEHPEADNHFQDQQLHVQLDRMGDKGQWAYYGIHAFVHTMLHHWNLYMIQYKELCSAMLICQLSVHVCACHKTFAFLSP